jgi:tRNA(fMet)-specific endonuclease VapC
MLKNMLDTDTCIKVIRNREPKLGPIFQREVRALCISTIVLHELRHGAEYSERPAFHHEKVDDFSTRLTIVDFDGEAAMHAASVKARLRRQGQIIGPNDILIAGHALSLGLTLITGNLKEFNRVEGLRCEDWLA